MQIKKSFSFNPRLGNAQGMNQMRQKNIPVLVKNWLCKENSNFENGKVAVYLTLLITKDLG